MDEGDGRNVRARAEVSDAESESDDMRGTDGESDLEVQNGADAGVEVPSEMEVESEDCDDVAAGLGISLDAPEVLMREPPTSTLEFLESHKIGQHHIKQCFMGVDADNARSPCDVREQKKNTFMFVDRLDEKGSTPVMIQNVLYCLHMLSKNYNSLRHGSDKSGDLPFDVPHARPNDAYTLINYGACYHKYLYDFSVVTSPILDITMHIEQATTGGPKPLTVFYMLLKVDCPITFDLVDNINRSCRKQCNNLKETLLCQDLQKLWVEIVHHQSSFGGKVGECMLQNVAIDFASLFDTDSGHCMWKLCRPPVCIDTMRRNMHMVATGYVMARSKLRYEKARSMVCVKFAHIDNVFGDNIEGHLFDAIWSDLCVKCCIAYENQHTQYRKAVMAAKKPKKKSARDQMQDLEDNPDGIDNGGADEEVLPFDPPVIYSMPTRINWDNDHLADFITLFSADPASNKVAEFERILELYPDDIDMHDFPVTMLTVAVEMTLLLPLENSYVSLDEWKMVNKDCLLPNNITLPILMMQHQRSLVNRPSLSMFAGDLQGIPKDMLTMADMRKMLLSSNIQTNSMMYFRAHSIFELQEQSMMQHDNPTQRVYAYSMYLLSTAYPLAMTNASSDTGQYGGSDPRVSVFAKLGESAFPSSKFQSSIAQGFTEAADIVREELVDEKWHLQDHRGTLISSMLLMNGSLAFSNRNWRLKANNVELMFRCIISDIGMNICFLVYAMQMAANGIGFMNWIKNFGGNILSDARRVDTPYEERLEKGRGAGADKTLGEFTDSQHSGSYRQPKGVDISQIPVIEDCKGFTSAAFWHRYTVTVAADGKVLSRPQSEPATVYCTDITPWDPKQAASGAVNQHEKFCALTPRNTLSASAGKRTTTMRDERTQNFVSVDQYLSKFLRCLALAQNLRTGNAFEQTLKVVCWSCPAGAVDTPRGARGQSAGADGRHDMGEEGKYTSQNIVPRIKECTRLLNHDAVGLALVVADTQKRGYYGKIRSLVEAPVFDVIANLVRMHTMYMLPDAATHAEWGRHVQKVQARMPPTGLLLHSIHALSHPSVHAMSFADIVHHTAYNWTANPCPMETLPMFIATMISNTFDWGFWLVLGIFAELFEIPGIPADELELLFSDQDHSVSTRHTGPLCEWLETFGFGDGAGTQRAGDVIYQKLGASAMARSAVYISTVSSGDAELASDDLACVIGSEKFQGSSFGAGGGAPAPTGKERKVAKHVAKIIFDKYESRLSGACNITTADAVEIMLFRYMNKPMHFPKFGRVPACRGVESVNSILERLNNDMTDAGAAGSSDNENYVDGSADAAQKSKTASGHSYRVAPWTCVNTGGNVWKFGVELRFLLMARSIFGSNHGVSQTSVQKVWDHMTRQVLLERIPATIFPYSTYVTSMPDPDGLALSISTIPYDSQRPTTMMRALPTSAVVDKNKSEIPGLLACGEMPEDVNIVAAQIRLAARMSDKIITVRHVDVHAEELCTPPIPLDTWVSVDVVHRSMSQQTDFACGNATYQQAALYIDSATQSVSWVQQNEVRDPIVLKAKQEMMGMSSHFSQQVEDAWQEPVVVRSYSTIDVALTATAKHFTRFQPIYHRYGVLLELPVLGALTMYMVLRPWQAQDVIGRLKPPAYGRAVWFNPSTMGYLVGAEAVPDDESLSHRLWPSVKELLGSEDDDEPEDENFTAKRDNFFTVVQESLSFDEEVVGSHQGFKDLIHEQMLVFTEQNAVVASLSGAQMEAYMVKTGEPILLDLLHPCIYDRYSKLAMLSESIASLKSRTPLKKFIKHDLAQKLHPVTECMLLYELPETIAPRDDEYEESQVWVGIREIDVATKHVDAVFLAVPSRALLPRSRLLCMGLEPVLFDMHRASGK